jgi:hypothetical protein
MTTVASRVQFNISAKDQTAAAFASARRSMQGIATAGASIKAAFAGAFAAFLGGNAIKNVIRSFIDINKELTPVKNSFTTLDRAWQAFALNVGRSGLNAALLNFSTRMSEMIISLDGLSNSIGTFLGGAINELTQVFEFAGRAIAFASDNLAIFKNSMTSFSGSKGPIKIFDVDAAVISTLKDIGLNTKALETSLDSLKPKLATLPQTFKEVADANKKADYQMKKLRDTAQSMFLETRSPLEKYQMGLRELNVLQAQGVLIQDTYARELEKLKEEFLGTGKTIKESFNVMAEVGDMFKTSFMSAFQGIADGSKSVKEAISSMASSILSDLTNLLANRAISTLLGGLLGGPNNIGGVSGLTFKAAGGPVSAGAPYVVGERGPETFVPGTSGSIVPNGALGGGMKVIVNNYAPARVETSKDSSGSLIITMRKMVSDTIGGGYADSALKSRHGLQPVKARRS